MRRRNWNIDKTISALWGAGRGLGSIFKVLKFFKDIGEKHVNSLVAVQWVLIEP